VPKVGNIWIPIDTNIRNCCSQFYKPKFNDRIKRGDCILRIYSCGKDYHMICWLYCIDLYGRFFWRYVSRNDMEYIIRIGSNRLQFVEYEEKEKRVEIGN
jgi:hypothetical protein